jgi:hypothetical protein
MIQMHYSISDALEECIARIETDKRPVLRRIKLGPVARQGVVKSVERIEERMVAGSDAFLQVADLVTSAIRRRSGSNGSSETLGEESDYDDFEATWTDPKM